MEYTDYWPDDSDDSLKIKLSSLKALKTQDWWQDDSLSAAVTLCGLHNNWWQLGLSYAFAVMLSSSLRRKGLKGDSCYSELSPASNCHQ